MVRKGSYLHEATLNDIIKELKQEGYRVITFGSAVPDAIAFKSDKICAVEALGLMLRLYPSGKPRGWVPRNRNNTYAYERRNYNMFDDVIFATFKYSKSVKKLRAIKAKRL